MSMTEMPVVLDTRVVTAEGGGPDKTILHSPRPLLACGYRMLCAYMHPPDDPGFERLREKAALCAAPLLSVPDRGPWDWKVASQLLGICRRERVDIWHGHDYKSNLLGLLLRPFWPMQLVTTVHGWVKHTRRTPLYYALDRFSLARYQKVLCVSPDLHQECLARGVAPQRCLLVENAIDTTVYRRSRPLSEAKRALGIAPQRLVIGAAGRLSPEKGFDILIRAADLLLQSEIDLELHILGEGDDRPRLERLITELGCGERVKLKGYQTDLRSHYEAMDVFALSSLREGLPNVVLEAMALEVPVVATAVAGLPRLIRDGVNGILIPPGNLAALTEALIDVLRDRHRRADIRRAARRTVQEQYSFEQRIGKLRAVYDELLGRERVLPPSADPCGEAQPSLAEPSRVPPMVSSQRGAS
jgi:glycosyltransferase involved in cell wall biosynthesis